MFERLFLLILLVYPLFLRAEELYTIVEDRAKIPLLTPALVERQTLKLRLDNGLEAYIISDPGAVKSAAALAVQVGSWQDPPNYPGLAHFLEHMLFLGTEKYPIESDYDRYIKEHDGKDNAYTASDHTLFLFSINNDAFEEALDRFSNFFKRPLFNPSGVSRELQAINQEFAKNFNSDAVREFYILKELSNPKHPFYLFSAGNSDTLSKVSQETLKKWYQEHYSANLMHLIVYSPLPLETLKNLVVQDFSGIINDDRPIASVPLPIYDSSYKGKIVYIDPVQNTRTLRLSWELPPAFAHMKETRPADMICYVIGYEGPGSLLASLKDKNLAESLDCSGAYLDEDHYLLSISITLTEEGLQDLDQVIEECFAALNLIKKGPLPSYLFDDFKQINTLRYQYQSREDPFDYLMQMGELLIRENLATYPEHELIPQKFDPQAVKELAEYLTPQEALITVKAKLEELKLPPSQRERWMQIPYTIRSVPAQTLQAWSRAKPGPDLTLPKPNPFIPRQLHVLPSPISQEKREIPHPTLIVDDDFGKVYYAQDDKFRQPQTIWFFEIKTPQIEQANPLSVALAELYVKCLQYALAPYSYDAKVADLEYEIERKENSIHLTLKGYSDNAEKLFETILNGLKNCQPNEVLFQILKDSLMREYQNTLQEGPLNYGFEIYQSIIYQEFVTSEQKALALKGVVLSQFLDYIKHLFDQTYTQGLMYGNLEKGQALKVWEKLNQALASQPYPLKEQSERKVIALPTKQGPYALSIKGNFSGNAAILGVEDPLFSFKTRAAQQILSQGMSNPFYTALRTKQQTGYIVFNEAEELEKHLFSFFAVQSNTLDPRDLLARFELFIEGFLQEMSKSELTQERFEIIRQSLMTTLEQPPQNLIAMGYLLKTLAFKYKGDFDWIAKRVQGFAQLTYEEFLEIATRFLGKSNKKRLAVLVEGEVTQDKSFKYVEMKQAEDIRKVSQYTLVNIEDKNP